MLSSSYANGPSANNRQKLAERERSVAEWQAAHARRSLAGALAGSGSCE